MAWSALAAALLLAAGDVTSGAQPATPANPPPTTAAAQKPAKPPKPKLICEESQQTGSLFTQRVCATKEEWEARRRQDAEEINRLGDDRRTCTTQC